MSASLDTDTLELVRFGRKAAGHLISYARDRVGLDVEMSGCGLESAGSFTDPHDDDSAEWRQVLFSCLVLETLVGRKHPALEFERLVAAAQGNLLPDWSDAAKPKERKAE